MLSHLQPFVGQLVAYQRRPFTFTARITNITPRGNVRLRLFLRDGRQIPPLIVTVKPARISPYAGLFHPFLSVAV